MPIYKIASASLTDEEMISVLKTDKSIILSTGMSSLEEINKTVDLLGIMSWRYYTQLAPIHANLKN